MRTAGHPRRRFPGLHTTWFRAALVTLAGCGGWVAVALVDTSRQGIRVAIAAAGGGLTLLVGGALAITTNRALRRLHSRTQRAVAGDFSSPLRPAVGPTEVRSLAGAVDHLVGALVARTERIEALSATTDSLRAAEEEAQRRTHIDPLTGLANRAATLDALAARTSGTALMIDVDGFRSVNDTQGHAGGDRVLAELADDLRAACPDAHLGRLGGDEFLVLLDTTGDAATEVAHRALTALTTPRNGRDGARFVVSTSLGMLDLTPGHEPLDTVARLAAAVAAAKESGGSRIERFDQAMSHRLAARSDMALSMRQAIPGGEFAILLQPFMESTTGAITGAEVLVRWMRPGGEVLPSEFIPVAEATGLILELETWVLEQSVRLLREWRIQPETASLTLAVNLSGRHIVDGTLVPLVRRLCDEANIDPRLLEVEITETHLVDDIGRAGAVVGQLRDSGVRVGIDDFGTGYSSMAYLHALRVDTVKIDQMFIRGMGDSDLDRTIVELLVRLGTSLDMTVIAEGVDSPELLETLAAMGCPILQGYHIARPMPAADFVGWLRERSLVSGA